jgi:hypothetical protein
MESGRPLFPDPDSVVPAKAGTHKRWRSRFSQPVLLDPGLRRDDGQAQRTLYAFIER